MNTPLPVQQPTTSTWSMYRAIVGIGALCALLIVTVYQSTAARISRNQEQYLARAIFEVLPVAQSTIAVGLAEDGSLSVSAALPALPVFLGYDENQVLAGGGRYRAGHGLPGQHTSAVCVFVRDGCHCRLQGAGQ